ncbi:MAG: sulfurtransferase [Rhodocyclaceae bacterium]|nr:sulfurtransferase [Rhodocyclaceae bacterium]
MGPLVSAEAVAENLRDWRIVDCRHDLRNLDYGAQAYAKGHIPGAVFMHMDRDLSGELTGSNGRHPLPSREAFAAVLSASGIGPDTQVVAYDNESGIFASRLWWMLRWIGHPADKAAVLNGGLPAWKRAKLPLETDVPEYPFVPYPAREGEDPVDLAEMLHVYNSPEVLMLDARAEDRFAGENETLDPVGGHIPGAVNRFYFDNLDDAGVYFKPADELREEYTALLAGREPRQVIQQCGSGVTACHNLLAMEAAGLTGSRLYVGSWSEWCSDPSRPVATGE